MASPASSAAAAPLVGSSGSSITEQEVSPELQDFINGLVRCKVVVIHMNADGEGPLTCVCCEADWRRTSSASATSSSAAASSASSSAFHIGQRTEKRSVLTGDVKQQRCHGCNRLNHEPAAWKVCSGCFVPYCGRTCQLNHWPEHKPYCTDPSRSEVPNRIAPPPAPPAAGDFVSNGTTHANPFTRAPANCLLARGLVYKSKEGVHGFGSISKRRGFLADLIGEVGTHFAKCHFGQPNVVAWLQHMADKQLGVLCYVTQTFVPWGRGRFMDYVLNAHYDREGGRPTILQRQAKYVTCHVCRTDQVDGLMCVVIAPA